MASADDAGRRPPQDDRVLPEALRRVRAGRRRDRAAGIGQAIPFNTLHPGEDAADVQAAIQRVIARGWFILGPEVEAFETEFAAAGGAAHAVAVGNGPDAIALLLRALDVGAGGEVIVPAITAAYTALAV